MWNILYKYGWYKQKNVWKNGIETEYCETEYWRDIVAEKHIKEGLGHKHLPVNTVNYLSDYGKHRYEPVDEPKNNPTEFLYAKNEQLK